MCGLFGVLNVSSVDLDKAKQALNTLIHRGPDQESHFIDHKVFIGHRRLSILDLSEKGKQPMLSKDGQVIISCNGEIYNYLALKNELSVKYEFLSCSDSEVILHGYIEWGIDGLLDRIDGMYVFTIYDLRNQEFFIARDRAGIKPLYYSTLNNQISWASELKAITSFYGEQSILEVDYTSVYDFLTYLYIPAPKSLYKDVYKLEPAHFLKIDLNTLEIKKYKYWSLEAKSCNDNLEEAIIKVSLLLNKSVEEQLISDVPVGFFLSGGIDSTVIVALASKYHKLVRTFTIGFNESSHDESGFASLVSKQYSTKHEQRILEYKKALELVDELICWFDEPFGDTSFIPTFIVSKLARQHSTVVLTGDGGDELFGGYKWYKDFDKIKKYKLSSFPENSALFFSFFRKYKIFRPIVDFVEIYLILDDLGIYTRLLGGMTKSEKIKYRKLWNIDEGYDDYWHFRRFYNPKLTVYKRLQLLDFHTYLPDDIFTKVDRVSMKVSLECRVPFMKKELIEYLFSLPDEIRILDGELKGLLKKSFSVEIPEEIQLREKKGFSIPLRKWTNFTGPFRNRQFKVLSLFIKDFRNSAV